MTKPTPDVPLAPGSDRLADFMTKHGLCTTTDMAQVFRVGQSTVSRWVGQAKEKPLEDVLPGPAMILLELFESGIETPDLITMREMAELREHPTSERPIAAEMRWSVNIPTNARYGAKIVSDTGHYVVVHSRWFTERITKLKKQAAEAETPDRRRAQRLIERYEMARDELTSLPR